MATYHSFLDQLVLSLHKELEYDPPRPITREELKKAWKQKEDDEAKRTRCLELIEAAVERRLKNLPAPKVEYPAGTLPHPGEDECIEFVKQIKLPDVKLVPLEENITFKDYRMDDIIKNHLQAALNRAIERMFKEEEKKQGESPMKKPKFGTFKEY